MFVTGRGDAAVPAKTTASLAAQSLAKPEPLAVKPAGAWVMLTCSNTHGYELLAAGELDSYLDGRSRKITVESIHRYISRRLAASTPARGIREPVAVLGRAKGPHKDSASDVTRPHLRRRPQRKSLATGEPS
jgi:hypothetical protein